MPREFPGATTCRRFLSRIGALVLSAGVGPFSGCTHIVTQTTAYYEDGPTQPQEPEGDLEAGTKAWVVGEKSGYVRVWTETGVNAWVWDRAVMTIWDYNQKQDEEKKRREAHEKWLNAQGVPAAPTTSQGDESSPNKAIPDSPPTESEPPAE